MLRRIIKRKFASQLGTLRKNEKNNKKIIVFPIRTESKIEDKN